MHLPSNPIHTAITAPWRSALAKTNYRFEKRQRDMAKKRKQEEKRQRKLAAKAGAESDADTGEGGAERAESPPSVEVNENAGTNSSTEQEP